MRIISLDPGFGDIKVAVAADITAKPEYYKHINAVAKLGKEKPEDCDDVVELNGEYYMIGLTAVNASSSQIMPIVDYESLKAITPLVLKKYLKKYNDNNDTQIVVSLSLAFQQYAGDYKKFLSTTLNLDEGKLFLVPQGVGCKVALDELGFNVEDPSLKIPCKNYLGVDIGFNTIDVIKVINGVLIKGNIQGYSNMGVTKIMQMIREDIKEMGCEESINDAQIKVALSTGYLIIRGTQYALQDKIKARVEQYIAEVYDFLEKNYAEDLNSIEFLVLFGGGANLVGKNQDKWSQYYKPSFVKIPVTPEFYNALGGLYYPSKLKAN